MVAPSAGPGSGPSWWGGGGCTRMNGGEAAKGPTEGGAHDGAEEEGGGPVSEATDVGAHDGGEHRWARYFKKVAEIALNAKKIF